MIGVQGIHGTRETAGRQDGRRRKREANKTATEADGRELVVGVEWSREGGGMRLDGSSDVDRAPGSWYAG
jgi:hypothetical protein